PFPAYSGQGERSPAFLGVRHDAFTGLHRVVSTESVEGVEGDVRPARKGKGVRAGEEPRRGARTAHRDGNGVRREAAGLRLIEQLEKAAQGTERPFRRGGAAGDDVGMPPFGP